MYWQPRRSVTRLLNHMSFGLLGALDLLLRPWLNLKDAEAAIVPGPELFADYAGRGGATRATLLAWILWGRLIGVRIGLVSASISAHASLMDRFWARLLVRCCTFVSVRDEASRRYLWPQHRAAQITVVPDLMFHLPRPRRVRPPPTEGAALTVAVEIVSAGSWPGSPERLASYTEHMAAFVHWLIDRGLTVRLLNVGSPDASTVEIFSAAITSRRFGQGRERLLCDPANDLDGLMSQITEADIVVASRYPVAVAAVCLCKPAVVLGGCPASMSMLSEAHFHGFTQPIDGIDLDLLIDQFTRLVIDRKGYEAGLVEVRAEMERRLVEQTARLAEFLRPA